MSEENNVFTEIEEKERQQALSIPAKRLRDKLLPLKSKEEQTAKRWFWELLQNASDYNKTVDILLEVDDSFVVFKHNGNPFSIEDVLNLISPDSGKDNDEIKKDNIGKFGSGLVSTHILSSEIEVEGAFKSESANKLYKFNILLNRSYYEDKDKLIDSIESTKTGFREINTPIENSEYLGFMTSFSYNLKKRLPGLSYSTDVVAAGLEYIYEVLTYTLCFMTKVQSVEIVDNRKNARIKSYLIKRKHTSDKLNSFVVKENSETCDIEFVKIKHKEVETVYRHKDGAVIPLPEGISKLFCGLPMIGSESIGLPFILNSFDFEPTLEREGVEITPNDTQNRKLLKDSVDLYQLLLDDIAKKKLDNAFCFTKLRNRYNGVEASKNIFKRDYVSEFKRKIEESRIVKSANDEFITFSEVLLPYRDGKPFKELYEYASEIKYRKLPTSSSYEGWLDATDFVLFPQQKYDLKQFVVELSQTSQTQLFVLQSDISVINWLVKIASLVNEENGNLFSEYAILPNQKGTLKKKKELSIDIDISSKLKTIFNLLNPEEIEINLLDKSFNDFDSVVERTFDTKDICIKIDNLLKEKYTADKASTATFSKPLNELYSWINACGKPKKELEELFTWFYPRRATLFMDSFGENERDYAFTIVQSGKVKALAALAQSEITSEELEYIGNNPHILEKVYEFMQREVDDKKNANLETGDFGEQLVYKDLRTKYKESSGYKVIWASKEGEARFDFEVKLKNETVFYIDAKTTMRGIANSDSIPFFMRNSQWEFLPTIDGTAKYLIARVFKGDQSIKYLQIEMV